MTHTREPPDPWPGAARPLRLAFPGEPADVRAALGSAISAFAAMNLPEAALGTIEIVLAEALNNVVEHAYAGGDPGRIDLVALPARQGIAFTIRDSGHPMPGGEIPPGRGHDLDVAAADLPEGGFGWQLIRALTRDLRYARDGAHNELTFVLPVG